MFYYFGPLSKGELISLLSNEALIDEQSEEAIIDHSNEIVIFLDIHVKGYDISFLSTTNVWLKWFLSNMLFK